MIIKSKNFDLKIEEILKDDLPIQTFNEYEIFALNLIKDWYSGNDYFIHQTSGSTGRPKKITLSRKRIEISTFATQEFIDPLKKNRTSLLCLDPKTIGGAMVLYRALILRQDVTLIVPSANPLENLGNQERYDIVSVAPIQYKNFTTEDIERFNVVLIGGAPMPVMSNKTETRIYSTFGMTETVSHIALRRIEDEFFHTTGDTIVGSNQDGSLKIKGSITNDQWIQTNDLVVMQGQNSFKWIGRKDFVINSGGIKISPEIIESSLVHQFTDDFMIGSLKDDRLGEKLILLCSGAERAFDFSHLQKYYKPKEIFFNQKIFKTEAGKLDRLKTQAHFESQL